MNPMKQLDDLRAYLYGCLERRDFAAAMTAVGELARLCPAEAAGLRVSIAVEQGTLQRPRLRCRVFWHWHRKSRIRFF